MTDFVPPNIFENIVSKGLIFEDLVGDRHGRQTHRLQWFIIQEELGSQLAINLFKDSVSPRWIVGSKNMWDFIVDSSEPDFTSPEYLTAYIRDADIAAFPSIQGEVKAEQDVNKGTKAEKTHMRQLYPPVRKYPDNLKALDEIIRKLQGKIDQPGIGQNKKEALYQDRDAQIHPYSNTVITHKGFQWTDWIAASASQMGWPNDRNLVLVPTVAYRRSHTPA